MQAVVSSLSFPFLQTLPASSAARYVTCCGHPSCMLQSAPVDDEVLLLLLLLLLLLFCCCCSAAAAAAARHMSCAGLGMLDSSGGRLAVEGLEGNASLLSAGGENVKVSQLVAGDLATSGSTGISLTGVWAVLQDAALADNKNITLAITANETE